MKYAMQVGMGLLAISSLAMGRNADAGEKELLEILLANHVITEQQYDSLSEGAEAWEERQKKITWVERIQLKGDMRLRQERIDIDGR